MGRPKWDLGPHFLFLSVKELLYLSSFEMTACMSGCVKIGQHQGVVRSPVRGPQEQAAPRGGWNPSMRALSRNAAEWGRRGCLAQGKAMETSRLSAACSVSVRVAPVDRGSLPPTERGQGMCAHRTPLPRSWLRNAKGVIWWRPHPPQESRSRACRSVWEAEGHQVHRRLEFQPRPSSPTVVRWRKHSPDATSSWEGLGRGSLEPRTHSGRGDGNCGQPRSQP